MANSYFTAMYAVFYFVDLFFVLVEQVGPSRAGLQLLFYTPGIGGKFSKSYRGSQKAPTSSNMNTN